MPYFSNAFQIISMTFHCVSLKNKDLYRYMYNGLINCIIWILVYAPVAPVTPLHWKIRFYSNHVQRETTHLSLLSKIEIIYCIIKLWKIINNGKFEFKARVEAIRIQSTKLTVIFLYTYHCGWLILGVYL